MEPRDWLLIAGGITNGTRFLGPVPWASPLGQSPGPVPWASPLSLGNEIKKPHPLCVVLASNPLVREGQPKRLYVEAKSPTRASASCARSRGGGLWLARHVDAIGLSFCLPRPTAPFIRLKSKAAQGRRA
jgi:hypothetical protein